MPFNPQLETRHLIAALIILAALTGSIIFLAELSKPALTATANCIQGRCLEVNISRIIGLPAWKVEIENNEPAGIATQATLSHQDYFVTTDLATTELKCAAKDVSLYLELSFGKFATVDGDINEHREGDRNMVVFLGDIEFGERKIIFVNFEK